LISTGGGCKHGVHALEIGCGTGLFTEMVAESGASILAVDISEELLIEARQRGLDSEQVQFVCKGFEECDVDGPFDAVVGSSILHHLEFDMTFPKIFELLKPGGIMSFAEPNLLNPQILVIKKVKWIGRMLGESPDETAFVRFTLKKQLEAIGFTDVEITPFDWLHPMTPRPLIPLIKGLGKIVERIPLCREFSGSLHIKATRPK
jgi:2-polyprenyl-3-methyl-5-hydroxy-6-metoxy-1,4-benzoquinol methylase